MADSAAPPSRPSLRGGRYVLSGQLGAGAQGTTWAAVDRRDGRPVAIKRFDVRGARAWKDVELAEREARVLAELSHPKLPRYIEHFEEEGVLYLVMEKIDGATLSELHAKGPMSERDVTRLLRDADDVLSYLHLRSPPIIHRDLKPGNVLRRADGSFAFVDFGSVSSRLRPEGGSTVVGTFGYMAPEQFLGRAGPGSDVYSIGATAVAMLTGEEPERWPRQGLGIDVDVALKGRATSRLCETLRRMLDIDPDRRPTRIGPLLDGERFEPVLALPSEGVAARLRSAATQPFRLTPRFVVLIGLLVLTLAFAVFMVPGGPIFLEMALILLVSLGLLIAPFVVIAFLIHRYARARLARRWPPMPARAAAPDERPRVPIGLPEETPDWSDDADARRRSTDPLDR